MARGGATLGATLARVVPAGFVLGAAMEAFMVHVTVGSESFYQTALRLEAERRAAGAADVRAAEARIARATADAAARNPGAHAR